MPDSESEFVLCNGVKVVADWPERLKEAQTMVTIGIEDAVYPRVRYGEEAEDWGAEEGPCSDCAAGKGQFHVPACEVERCPRCGGQAITCDCPYDIDEEGDASASAGE